MTKANSVEAEIDEILDRHTMATIQSANAATDGLPLCNDAEFRRQILSVMKKKTLELPNKSGKLGITVMLTHDFWQALKNSRRDGDG